eukprot:358313-Chlamydomonas_euryale.AAC.9
MAPPGMPTMPALDPMMEAEMQYRHDLLTSAMHAVLSKQLHACTQCHACNTMQAALRMHPAPCMQCNVCSTMPAPSATHALQCRQHDVCAQRHACSAMQSARERTQRNACSAMQSARARTRRHACSAIQAASCTPQQHACSARHAVPCTPRHAQYAMRAAPCSSRRVCSAFMQHHAHSMQVRYVGHVGSTRPRAPYNRARHGPLGVTTGALAAMHWQMSMQAPQRRAWPA